MFEGQAVRGAKANWLLMRAHCIGFACTDCQFCLDVSLLGVGENHKKFVSVTSRTLQDILGFHILLYIVFSIFTAIVLSTHFWNGSIVSEMGSYTVFNI